MQGSPILWYHKKDKIMEKEKKFHNKEKLFLVSLLSSTFIIVVLFGGILFSLFSESKLSLEKYSLRFLYDEIWQPSISAEDNIIDKEINIKSVITSSSKSDYYLAISTENNSQNEYKDINFSLFTNYKLEDFSSSNISRRGAVSLESVFIKFSPNDTNIADVTDCFDLEWDYFTKHHKTFFSINIKANDTILSIPANATVTTVLGFDGVEFNQQVIEKSWAYKKHKKDIDEYDGDQIPILNYSSFDENIENYEAKPIYNRIEKHAKKNEFIVLSKFEDDEYYTITGIAESNEQYGALPYIIGTIITSLLALILAIPFALSIAIFLGEFFRDSKISNILKSLIDLISAIPSVIYGFWGLVFLIPIVSKIGSIFGIETSGISVLAASLVLAFMIIPYMATISAEVIKMVPNDLKEAAYGLGATRYEVIKHVILPYTKSGIISGVILSLGRGLGETMAVTMLIGNITGKISLNIFDPSNTMASIIANNFAEAGTVLMSSLTEIALILFVLTTIISFAGRYYIRRSML